MSEQGPADRTRRAWCPRCDHGWVGHFIVRDRAVELFVCGDCEATWRSSADIDPATFRDLSDVLVEIGTDPGWDTLVDARPHEWFRDLGYALVVDLDSDSVFWAGIWSLANAESRVERYGRGDTEVQAAESARRRWQVEELGSPADNRSDLNDRLP